MAIKTSIWEDPDQLTPPVGVDSVFTRTGAIIAVAGDYNASDVANDSTVVGTFVSDALTKLKDNNGGIIFDTSVPIPAYAEGKLFYDNVHHTFTFFDSISGTSIQVGQENILFGINDSGVQINNGELVYISGHNGTNKLMKLANSNSRGTSQGTIAMATHNIAIGAEGKFTRIGTVRDLDTIGCAAGDTLYLSNVDGEFTNVRPTSPLYIVILGTCSKSHLTEGEIEVSINAGNNTSDVIKIFNGAILEDHTIMVSSNGVIVTLTLEQAGGGDLSLFFNGEFTVFDTTPPASIILTEGTDTTPQRNYVYIPVSTKVLTVSTVGFPTSEQFVPIADILVQSVVSVQTYGCYKVHAWTDHLSDIVGEGHLQHVNKWIRKQPATYENGISISNTIVVQGAAPDDIYFSSGVGAVLQLHEHNFPAFDMQTGDEVRVVNDFTTPYIVSTNLNDIILDSLGNNLRSNNTYYSLIIWGVVSEEDVDCKLMINAPSGSYSNSVDAIADPLGFNDYSIPSEYIGTGFLIAKIVLRYQTLASGTISEVLLESLLGAALGGGGSVATNHNTLSNLELANTGVVWGHINALAQSIFGKKTFDDLNIVSDPPSSASDTGTAGDVTWDADFFYICVSTDAWKRVAIATW